MSTTVKTGERPRSRAYARVRAARKACYTEADGPKRLIDLDAEIPDMMSQNSVARIASPHPPGSRITPVAVPAGAACAYT